MRTEESRTAGNKHCLCPLRVSFLSHRRFLLYAGHAALPMSKLRAAALGCVNAVTNSRALAAPVWDA
ncbi:hypothetical protein, partial [Mesorhizobium sp.]|uniref:hypothetical protein n=1 Tax=Mesorhizobium sp. TaxID=1871066 RepID=UPI0025C0B7FE